MTRIAAAAAALAACLFAGCANYNRAIPTDAVVRSAAPRNHESAITNYFDATVRGIDPNRELVIGTPQRGACPMGGNAGGYVGWVVPVEYKTRARDSSVVTVTSYFFWFSDEVIRGVTRRMEVCP
jgi:ABC-type amino acid transport substrate-binding protein